MRIIIIGGGLAGITLAYLLRDEDVVVLEKDFVGSGETGYSTGVFPINKSLDFYREIQEFTLNYFSPVIYDHLMNGKRGRSIYVDGYNFCYYTSIVLEKNGMNIEVMNEAFELVKDENRVVEIKSKRGNFSGDIYVIAAGASTPFLVGKKGARFSWVRSLLLKPHKKFEPLVIYDDDFVIKPEGDERIIIRETSGRPVELGKDILNKTRGVDEAFYEKVFNYLEAKNSPFLDSDVERGWATICTETESPVEKVYENLYTFYGFGCQGFGIIPDLAKKLKEEILK